MDLVFYNNLLSLPLLACFIWIDDVPAIPHQLKAINTMGWVWVALSMAVAGTISFAGFGLAGAVTSTTATVCQHVSKIVSMLASIPVFHTLFPPTMWAAVAVTFAGTGWYSYERTQEAAAKKAAAAGSKSVKTEDSSLLSGNGERACPGIPCFSVC